MPNWKVLISDAIEEECKALLRAAGIDFDDRPTISAEELQAEIVNYDALIVRGRTQVTRPVIEAGDRLKIVGRAGVGVDNIDLAAAQSNGISVVNSPTATTDAVAEHTLALLLALVRNIPRADVSMKAGQWAKKDLTGVELGGKTLGIVGFGRIGQGVGARARGFGMRIIAYDPFLDDKTIRANGGEPVSLEDLYRQSDVISLHMPLTPDTKNMLDGEAFAQMKRGVYVVCAARGGIIDETALLSSLESGQAAGAGLDVFAEEPPGLSALVAHPNVVAAPHIGAQTEEAQVRAAQHIAEEIIAGLKGEPLRWKVV
jgi:D-3-phosphoglycerate dehydrogenase